MGRKGHDYKCFVQILHTTGTRLIQHDTATVKPSVDDSLCDGKCLSLLELICTYNISTRFYCTFNVGSMVL